MKFKLDLTLESDILYICSLFILQCFLAAYLSYGVKNSSLYWGSLIVNLQNLCYIEYLSFAENCTTGFYIVRYWGNILSGRFIYRDNELEIQTSSWNLLLVIQKLCQLPIQKLLLSLDDVCATEPHNLA